MGYFLFSLLVPHFATKTFCLNQIEGGEAFDAVCLYKDRLEGEEFDAVVDISYFNFFLMTLFPKEKVETFRKFEKNDVL